MLRLLYNVLCVVRLFVLVSLLQFQHLYILVLYYDPSGRPLARPIARGLEVGQRTVHRGGRRFGHQVGIRPASRTEVTPKKIVLQQHSSERTRRSDRPDRVGELRSAWALAGESCARAPRSNTRCRGMQSREGQDGHDQASCWASREGQYGDDQNP